MRVFIAIEPDLESRRRIEALLQLARPQLARCGRLTDICNIHLTLLFVGDWPADQMDPLERMLDEAASSAKPFKITFDRFGTFGHGRKDTRGKPGPQILWLGHSSRHTDTRQAPDPDLLTLSALVDRLRRDARMIGIPAETRPFSPHLTISRQMPAGQASEILASLPPFEPIRFQVYTLTLMQSIPDAGHMRYEPVKRATIR